MRSTTILVSLAAACLVLAPGCKTYDTPGPGAPGPENTPVKPVPDTTPTEPPEPVPTEPEPPDEPNGPVYEPAPEPDVAPEQLHDQVTSALARSRRVDASEIELWIEGRTVYLSGWVDSEAEKATALQIVEDVPGVGKVFGTDLRVRGGEGGR